VAYERRHDTELDALRVLDTAALRSRGEADRALADRIPNPSIRQFLLKNLVRGGDGFAWRIPLDTIAACYAQIAAAPTDGHYDAPALFLRAGASDYIRPEHEAAIKQRFPSARVETIDGAAHWLHIEAPEAVIELARPFLSL
jgi:esterase